ncbi:MAG: amidohydrolase family protein, partial [Rubrivivax sp.]|nr:amidohydrolase family protein [Rubrivivax sp.]
HGRRVYAHVPHAMTLEDVLALRVDSIEHLEGFARALGGQGWGQAAWASADPARMAALARRVADSGVWSAPTLVVMLAPERAFADLAAAEAAPPMRYANAALLGFWRSAAARAPVGTDFAAGYALARRGHAHRVRMLSALREAGAPVLIGTDSPNPYLVYGFSLHEELAHFREAGYSNREILRIATLDAARFLNAEDRFGALEPGMRADLVMLDGDPERDLAALRAPAGVMAAGRWHDARALAAQLDEVAAIAAATRPAVR